MKLSERTCLVSILIPELLSSREGHQARLRVAATHVGAERDAVRAQHGVVQRDEGCGGAGQAALVRVHKVGLPPSVPGLQARSRLEAQQRQPCTDGPQSVR